VLLGGDRDSSTNRPSLSASSARVELSLSATRAHAGPCRRAHRPGRRCGSWHGAGARATTPRRAREEEGEGHDERKLRKPITRGRARARAAHWEARSSPGASPAPRWGPRPPWWAMRWLLWPAGLLCPGRGGWGSRKLVDRGVFLFGRALKGWFTLTRGVAVVSGGVGGALSPRSRSARLCVGERGTVLPLSLCALGSSTAPQISSLASEPTHNTSPIHNRFTLLATIDRKHAWRTSFTHRRFEARSGGRG
jgi:hypothetical protein